MTESKRDQYGVPRSWARHLATALLKKDRSLTPMRAELIAAHQLRELQSRANQKGDDV